MINKTRRHTRDRALAQPNRGLSKLGALTLLIISLSLALWKVSYAAVVPIPSIRMISNTCSAWHAEVTYTATTVPDELVEQLANYTHYSTWEHFHAANYPGGGQWIASVGMTGNNLNKLALINYTIFETYRPKPGQAVNQQIYHGGGCAGDEGLRECVGIFVNTSNAAVISPTPTTFPAGLCVGIPPANTSCTFDRDNENVNLGTGGPGERVGNTGVNVNCSRQTAYRIQDLSAGSSGPDSNVYDVNVEVGGKPLPATFTSSGGTDNHLITVRGKVRGSGTVSTSRILRIDIP